MSFKILDEIALLTTFSIYHIQCDALDKMKE